MQPVKINCPYCDNLFEYWTKNNYISCPKCAEKINVAPCTEPLDHEILKDDEENITDV